MTDMAASEARFLTLLRRAWEENLPMIVERLLRIVREGAEEDALRAADALWRTLEREGLPLPRQCLRA